MNRNKCRNKLLGKRFGKLIVEKFVGADERHNSICQCLCDCGKRKNVLTYRLKLKHTKSCGCARSHRRLQPYEWLYSQLQFSAKKTKRHVDLTFRDFLFFTTIKQCHYCGVGIEWSPFNQSGKNQGYHLDRKDNNEGYTKSNCVVCCRRCNWIKGNEFTYSEMLKLGESVKKILNSRTGKYDYTRT